LDNQKQLAGEKVRPKKPRKSVPSAEARTTVAPILNKGYSEAGASHTRKALAGMKPNSGSPAEDINENLLTLRQRSRMLYMGAPIATSAIRTNRTNVVGNGLQLKSTIDYLTLGMTQEQAEEWQRHTEAEFKLWASNKRSCDATGINDFYGLQQLALVSWLVSGDVLALTKFAKRETLRPYGLRLHLIEADRCRCPGTNGTLQTTASVKLESGGYIHDGVEIDKNGAIVAYHIANTHPYETGATKTEFVRVPAYGEKSGLPNVLHVMDSERPEQYRGVPYLAQVMEPLLQLRRYTEAEIMAALVQSFFTAFVKTDTGVDMPFNEVPQPEYDKDTNAYEMGPGTINMLEPGEDVTFGAPTHPNTGFDAFTRALCEQIGAALEVPADLLLKAFNASYSASRGALLEAWKAFRMRRTWLTNDFCRPVYEIWMTEAVALGRIHAPGFFTDPILRQAYLESEWIGPSAGQLDPTKEVQAAVTAIEHGLTTREAEAIKLNGSKYSANVATLQSENERLRAANGQQTQPVGE
jgi:lambda family phage portal protein